MKGWGYPDVRAFKLSREPQTPINTASTLRNEAKHLIPKSKPGRVAPSGLRQHYSPCRSSLGARLRRIL